jgi:hypothetical protein
LEVRFEEMTVAQVQARAATEGAVKRGRPLYDGRAWTRVHDEMVDAGAKRIADLPRSQVRALRKAIDAQARV